MPDPREDLRAGGAGGTDPDGSTTEHWVDISPASTQRSAPREGKMQLWSACEEGVRSRWEPTWDDGEWEHGRGPGCGLGMRQARTSWRRRKVEMDVLEDYLMFVQLLWNKKGEGNKSNVLMTLVWKMWSAGHGVWWPGTVTE